MDHFLDQMEGDPKPAVAVEPLAYARPYGPSTLMEPSSGDLQNIVSPPHHPSLISSDPKHALGCFHATHFNEWAVQESTESTVGLPRLDTDTVEHLLDC